MLEQVFWGLLICALVAAFIVILRATHLVRDYTIGLADQATTRVIESYRQELAQRVGSLHEADRLAKIREKQLRA